MQRLSVLIASLQAIQAEYGDLDVVSGLERSGYGESVLGAQVVEASPYDPENNNFAGPRVPVVDLVLNDSSSYQS